MVGYDPSTSYPPLRGVLRNTRQPFCRRTIAVVLSRSAPPVFVEADPLGLAPRCRRLPTEATYRHTLRVTPPAFAENPNALIDDIRRQPLRSRAVRRAAWVELHGQRVLHAAVWTTQRWTPWTISTRASLRQWRQDWGGAFAIIARFVTSTGGGAAISGCRSRACARDGRRTVRRLTVAGTADSRGGGSRVDARQAAGDGTCVTRRPDTSSEVSPFADALLRRPSPCGEAFGRHNLSGPTAR